MLLEKKYFNSLSDNCGYFPQIQHQDLISGVSLFKLRSYFFRAVLGLHQNWREDTESSRVSPALVHASLPDYQNPPKWGRCYNQRAYADSSSPPRVRSWHPGHSLLCILWVWADAYWPAHCPKNPLCPTCSSLPPLSPWLPLPWTVAIEIMTPCFLCPFGS